MQRVQGTGFRALLALMLVAATACGDDDKKHPDEDGGLLDSGLVGNMDSGIVGHTDSGAVIYEDGAIVAPDGAFVTVDSGSQMQADAASAQCAGNCDDNVDCTTDRCVQGQCVHSIDNSVCTGGKSCSLTQGCQLSGKTCANNGDCADTDGCTTNETCNVMLAVCHYDVLDRDGDGNPPTSCGGTDCNDASGFINIGQQEICDGYDNDCDGVVDDGATCTNGGVCSMGQCSCAAGTTECNGACVNFQTDKNHCGACNPTMGHPVVSCGTGGTCTAGACSCTPGGSIAMCGDTCSDTTVSETNCGGCNMPCAAVAQGGQTQSCIASKCTPCGGETQACCVGTASAASGDGCYNGTSCSGTPGATGSTCTCAAPSIKCGDACADLSTDEQNCGMCGKRCTGAQVCMPKNGTPTCTACGGVGEPCCDIGGFGLCTGQGLGCDSSHICQRIMVTQPGMGASPGN